MFSLCSRAELARPDELTTARCLMLQIIERLGTREVTLIGGEASLRSDV